MRTLKSLGLAFALLLALAANVPAQDLPLARPAEVGLSAERLDRITQWLKDDIAKGTIPGAVLMIARHGKIAYFESMGALDPQTKAPMSKDAIFRIYSMSKPITSVAVMMLVEQGKISLDDPIAKYIPAFKDVKVGVETKDADGKPKLELVAAQEADHRPGPAAPHLGPHLWLLRRHAGEEGLCRRQRRGRRPHQCGIRRAARQAAARVPARHHLGLQPLDRRSRPAGRGRVRQVALPVREGATSSIRSA